MPHVEIKCYPGRTEEQKRRCAEEVTKAISETTQAQAPDASDGTSGSQAPVTNILPIQHYPNAVYISVKEDGDAGLPVNGTVGDYEYTILSSSDSTIPMHKNLLTKINSLLAGFCFETTRHSKQTGVKSGLCFSRKYLCCLVNLHHSCVVYAQKLV